MRVVLQRRVPPVPEVLWKKKRRGQASMQFIVDGKQEMSRAFLVVIIFGMKIYARNEEIECSWAGEEWGNLFSK